MMKKALFFILAVALVVLLPLSTSAVVKDEIQPLYVNIRQIVIGFSIDKETGIASCSGDVLAYYSVPVEVLVQLQVNQNGTWKTLRSWSDTGTKYACVDQTYTVDAGYEYKVKVTGYICNDLGLPIESETEEKIVYYPAS